MKWLIKILCFIGFHKWDMPGGHCEDCGKCDEFFGEHKHYDKEGIIIEEYGEYNWKVILPMEAKNYFDNKSIETTTYICTIYKGNYVINCLTLSIAEEILQEWKNRKK